ncbi:hypothetical protein CDAR_268651 [Caerostris darwini]|uniref:Uncharacterized protein n=1 Tax=Caerostris darwini TaxID=1538125 RepID=A0AAV4X1K4_9ARAC|nr:hypothetical protein CDAR_268651 [Caerostris darwini]
MLYFIRRGWQRGYDLYPGGWVGVSTKWLTATDEEEGDYRWPLKIFQTQINPQTPCLLVKVQEQRTKSKDV